ncbi:hypothetical protein [Microbacterium suaedae]|uniref:hypothetical protein n=1 Tax=Microbacterium suaedae TaxID=2067813 RepID=UPI0018E08971|nr:hypothetical protein [Microbacterium suaedae]
MLAATIFGGDFSTFVALTEVTAKIGVFSLASLAAFVSLDPEKLSMRADSRSRRSMVGAPHTHRGLRYGWFDLRRATDP